MTELQSDIDWALRVATWNRLGYRVWDEKPWLLLNRPGRRFGERYMRRMDA